MPVTHFRIRWPDHTEEDCYSPSSVVTEHFEAGAVYPVQAFLELARIALNRASERVQAKYGYACSAAMDQLQIIEASAARFLDQPNATVVIVGFGR